jgi:hypothetical protein
VKAKTALVIDASAFIDYEQVQSYLASGKAAAITFSDVWIVLDNRVVPLKTRATMSGQPLNLELSD